MIKIMKKNLLKMLYQLYVKFNVVYVKVNIGQLNVHIKIIYNLLWIHRVTNQVKNLFLFSLFFFIFKISGENVTSSVNSSTLQGQNVSSGTAGEPSSNKWVSVSARRAGA